MAMEGGFYSKMLLFLKDPQRKMQVKSYKKRERDGRYFIWENHKNLSGRASNQLKMKVNRKRLGTIIVAVAL